MSRLPSDANLVFKTRGPLDPTADAHVCVPRPELDQLLRAVHAPTVDAYLALQSSRQTGKTTILYQLRARLRPRGYGAALVDLAVIREQSEAELYRFVASEMLSDLQPVLNKSLRGLSAPDLPTSPVEFRNFLLEIARQTHAPRLVIMIDEVEAVPEKHADAFFGTIRNVFSSRRKEDEAAFDKYLFVFAGAKELHRLTGGSNSPLNIAERIYLKDFDLAGVRMLVTNFKRASITAPDQTAQWIYEQTMGHPYLTQKVCSTIEQWHPGVITQEIVRRAGVQILKSDDHLEKIILQIDAENRPRQLLEQIVRGKSVPFSRLNPAVARLELLGAVRDNGGCVVRNPIYYAAFRSHFNLNSNGLMPKRSWLAMMVAAVAFLIFLINLPFLYNYAVDILFTTRSVNDQLSSNSLGTNILIHYDRILQANTADSTTITVDMDRLPASGPILVTFKPDTNDITLDGKRQRTIDQPFHQERFTFSLNQSGLGALHYNPFAPSTDHRRITLQFESAGRGVRLETYTADFLVDYFSAVAVSAAFSLAGLLTTLGFAFSGFNRFRHLLGMVRQGHPEPN